MFSESAELYDQIYLSFKDYAAEASQVAELVRGVHPRCRTMLDVACGTGEHARHLATGHGFEVDGIDLDPAFVRIASAKIPGGRFREADMVDFHLGRRYDAVLCLFSSIGYVGTVARVQLALSCFREHLAEGGIVIVEPWFAPDVLEHGRVSTVTTEAKGLHVVRASRMEVVGRLSRLHFDYEITGDGATRRATEVHELGLFTTGEMLDAFRAAGLIARHDAKGLTGRGLYVATTEAR